MTKASGQVPALYHRPSSDTPAALDIDSDAFVKAVGQELQRLRKANTGLSRRLFVKSLPGDIPENTYACYEQGIRVCPLPRLVVICSALDATVGDVVDNALTALGIPVQGRAVESPLDSIERAVAELKAAQR